MVKMRNVVVLFAVLVFCTPITEIYADTHMAASCSQANVQAAINAASDGDVVSIPSGPVPGPLVFRGQIKISRYRERGKDQQ